MIDRSYLPFQSARDYQDVNMQKWMGFFLPEHTSALSDNDKQVSYLSDLSLNQKLLLLSQSYANQLIIQVTTIQKNGLQNSIGTIPTLSTNEVILKTSGGHVTIALEDIISIALVEEVYHESD
ncbi:YolD-like protein [Streptococcus infantarius subsp. infantarius]|nr:YolD-like protein [Streptococcus infantarius subsp. infantarius]MCO4491247.1 YolD-like protein [Streptococcus infantarius subsp. infantarius]MCO4493176.1 YolD-like protein [Streptococcus infantarius subsp. infantarius]MCO4506917.1 YolD-like protein [Streptococcus infantarius subsp. infantarius]MCO4510511.1 YolD-like protein [Streptococcus infantarius subsp. infantarius]